jgi:hypothetical protein
MITVGLRRYDWLVRVLRGVPLPHFPGGSLKRSCTSVQRSSHANKLSPN